MYYNNGAWIHYYNNKLKLTIYSNKGYFFSKKRKANLKNKVKIFDGNYTLYSNAMEFLLEENIINFYTPAILKKERNVKNKLNNHLLLSNKTSFLINKRIFIFRKYKIYYKEIVFIGNSLFFDQKNGKLLFDNLSIKNRERKFLFKGHGIFDLNQKNISLKKRPNIIYSNKSSNSKYSIYINADFIKILEKNSTYLTYVFSVKNIIINKYIKGKCKFLIIDSSKRKIKFFGSPIILWIDKQKITEIPIHFIDFDEIKRKITIIFLNKENIYKKIFIKIRR
ncbi:hypothetical protein [Blattabacterium cuenoti]|uniref:hypothetical protein n=1 Tax=Blattabacterium cuenoti TaxID=1653831 RepID=UPI001EEC5FE1|nr:hypothetical protein [Blattabacterium cuenoti]